MTTASTVASRASAQVRVQPDTLGLQSWPADRPIDLNFVLANPRAIPVASLFIRMPTGIKLLAFGNSGRPQGVRIHGWRDSVEWWGPTLPTGSEHAAFLAVRFTNPKPGPIHFPVRLTWADSTTEEWSDTAGAHAAPSLTLRAAAPSRRNAVFLAAAGVLLVGGAIGIAARRRRGTASA